MQNNSYQSDLVDRFKKFNRNIPECNISDLSTIKCHLCYTTEVTAICIHCRKFVCRRCQCLARGGAFAASLLPSITRLAPKKLQYNAYCRFCFRKALGFIFVFGIISLLLGILTLISAVLSAMVQVVCKSQNPLWVILKLHFFCYTILLSKGWLLTSLLGVSAIVTEFMRRLLQPFLLERSKSFPGFPLFCKIYVDVEEIINANFNITGGDYLVLPSDLQGALQIILQLRASDLEKYKSILLLRACYALDEEVGSAFTREHGLLASRNQRRNLPIYSLRLPIGNSAKQCDDCSPCVSLH